MKKNIKNKPKRESENYTKKNVSLEKKIEIYKEFRKSGGKEINGKTVFKGYPIGMWGIQVRNSINHGKIKHISEKQIDELKKLGILERKIEATLDEKIEQLINWCEKYPKATIVPKVSDDILKKYSKNEDEFEKLKEEYEKLERYYIYIRYRKNYDVLSEETIKKCKQAGIGGVFGKTKEEQGKIDFYVDKYGMSEKYITYLLKKYKTIENYYKLWKEGKLKRNDMPYGRKMFKRAVDIDETSERGFDDLAYHIYYLQNYCGNKIIVYSSNKLKEEFKKLKYIEQYRLKNIYELSGKENSKNEKKMAEEEGVSQAYINKIKMDAERKLREKLVSNGDLFEFDDLKGGKENLENNIDYDFAERILDDIRLLNNVSEEDKENCFTFLEEKSKEVFKQTEEEPTRQELLAEVKANMKKRMLQERKLKKAVQKKSENSEKSGKAIDRN